MIKTEEVDSSSNGLQYQSNRNSVVLPPLPPLSSASSLHHYSMITPSGSILSDLNSIPVGHHHHPHPHHHPQQSHYPVSRHHHHHQLEGDEKPNMSYLNRHILHNPSSIHGHPMDMLPPHTFSSPPLNKSGSPSSSSPSLYAAPPPSSAPQIHDFGTASTIKYCSSNGLEILPIQSQHAYVIQQCPSSQSESVSRSNEVTSHEEQMETNVQHHHQHQTVLSSSTSSANHGNSGGQLEVVQYAGVPSHSHQQQQQQRKKESDSPISSAGSRSPSDEQHLPPDTTKKTNNSRRPEKPNMSYINMIACAIKESPDRMLTLNGIYNYLQQK